ncbi:hypothetical protein FCV25MIE_31965 [Fagus crenata]
MEGKQQHSKLAFMSMMLLMIWLVISPVLACPPNGGQCKVCIVNQMKFGCPSCAPLLRCMAQCLWGGSSRYICVNRCNCNTGYPNLSACKTCMSKCKCSCVG